MKIGRIVTELLSLQRTLCIGFLEAQFVFLDYKET